MTTSHHDKFFKKMFSGKDLAKDFFSNYLPGYILGQIDLTTLEATTDSFVDDQLKEHFSDLVYRVNMKRSQEAYVCILLEHKSHQDNRVSLQLLRYMTHMWTRIVSEKQASEYLPVIIPLVFYHGTTTWEGSTKFSSLFDATAELKEHIPNFKYILVDLSALADEKIKGDVKTRMTLLLQKHIGDPELVAKLADVATLYHQLSAGPNQLEILKAVAQYLIFTDKLTKEEMKVFLDQATSGKGEDIMPTVAEQFIEEGIQKGILQGIEQGIQKGAVGKAREAIIDGIEIRFGQVPNEITESIDQLSDTAVLKSLLKQAFVSKNLDEFIQALKKSKN
ncbi:MAG: Rpn family recombination-promoting nuclease/putative transposase [Deltaproteobacteria bacterium]|nr:Rpn family recombination-promoting nuclease/putative transposase [Deltaproteobacteria bacterium]MBF0526423.1 Rpn family recombination-promoting nuclease/putative transposase [Deltaproteobacteria bacterium]